MVVPQEKREFVRWLSGLSSKLGEVHYFGTHRVVDYHAWASAEGGDVRRAFAFLGERGEILFQVGEPTDDERHVGVPLDNVGVVDEDIVMALAARWSVDPTGIDGAFVTGLPFSSPIQSGSTETRVVGTPRARWSCSGGGSRAVASSSHGPPPRPAHTRAGVPTVHARRSPL